jgi:hypothetical protein
VKIIDVPDPIRMTLRQVRSVGAETVTVEGDLSWTFADFLQLSLDEYAPLGRGLKQIRQAVRISGILEKLNGAKEFQMEDADFAVVKEAVEARGWNAGVARRLLPFFEAVDKARDRS